jgi:hypothetical protein
MKYSDLNKFDINSDKTIKIVCLDGVANTSLLVQVENADKKDKVEVYQGNGELGCGFELNFSQLIQSPHFYFGCIAVFSIKSFTKGLFEELGKELAGAVIRLFKNQSWPSQVVLLLPEQKIHLRIIIPKNLTDLDEELLEQTINERIKLLTGPLTQILVYNPSSKDLTLIDEYENIT